MAQYNYILVVGEKEVGTGQVGKCFGINIVVYAYVYLLHFFVAPPFAHAPIEKPCT